MLKERNRLRMYGMNEGVDGKAKGWVKGPVTICNGIADV